ncbi:MAG: CD225/dispanin family protein [Deltaproteobacteria bacterium]|uniref:CD225/dispanin family protein n=1 Tax=Candidatus Zymogenus saltonus TaxID=2844893 RepID=A0A9D8PNN8_9DELT|nr:CD225/dispanin family protein [Candidatus Zymogenus saltonus]
MKCPNCKEENPQGSVKCSNCGKSLEPKALKKGESEYVPNYLAPAILVMIFCCLPFGVVSLAYAAQVNGRLIAGQREKALNASHMAKIWCFVTVGVGVLFWSVYFMIYFSIFGLAMIGAIIGSMQ